MKLDIEALLNPLANGPARANVAIVNGRTDGKDVVPAGVASVIMGDGRVVNLSLSGEEALMWGQALITAGAIALGGMPPVIEPQPPTPALHLMNGGRRG